MSSQEKKGIAPRLFLSLFGLIFFAAGSFFAYMILSETWENYKTRSWQKTPCVIVDSRVDVVEDGYEFEVGYEYEIQGREWSAYQYRLGSKNLFDSVTIADAKAREYYPGREAWCYVNPAQPGQAILEHNSLALGLTIFLPVVFMVIGAAALVSSWTQSSKSPRTPRSKTGSKDVWKSRLGLAGFFMIFFVVGGLVGYFFFIPAFVSSLTSGDWAETECTILSSRVKTHDSDDGDTYSVDIMYSYEVDGRTYRSSRYGFMDGSSSGYSGKREIVRRYPVGSKAVCYINPQDPTEAVLSRRLGGMALFAILPVLFMLVGGGGVLYALFAGKDSTPSYKRNLKNQQRSLSSSGSTASGSYHSMAGIQVLKPKNSALVKILGTLFAAVFWNGIVSVFLVQVVSGWRQGQGSIGLTLFISIFVFIGIAIILAFFHSVLAAFNPKLTITLYSDFICIGDEVKLNWAFKGNVNKIKRFRLSLTGMESASYTRGTDTVTDTHNFYKMIVVEHVNPAFMQQGEVRIQIPPATMHSFKSNNNSITWMLQVHCDIPKWPDTKDDYTIAVHPLQEGRLE